MNVVLAVPSAIAMMRMPAALALLAAVVVAVAPLAGLSTPSDNNTMTFCAAALCRALASSVLAALIPVAIAVLPVEVSASIAVFTRDPV